MHRLARLVGESQQLLGIGEEFAAAFGQAHALAVAQEQFDAQVLLELADPRGDVRLRSLQLLSGAGDAGFVGDRAEDFEGGKVHRSISL